MQLPYILERSEFVLKTWLETSSTIEDIQEIIRTEAYSLRKESMNWSES